MALDRRPIVRQERAPAPEVAIPPVGSPIGTEALPAGVLDVDAGAGAGGHEPDLDVRRVGAIGAQVPRVAEPVRRGPQRHPPPLVLIAAARPFEEAAADARLEDHQEAGVVLAGDRVIGRPPRRDPLGPGAERLLGRAEHVERQAEGLDDVRGRPPYASSLVLAATKRKRIAASPQTCSRYRRTASTPA